MDPPARSPLHALAAEAMATVSMTGDLVMPWDIAPFRDIFGSPSPVLPRMVVTSNELDLARVPAVDTQARGPEFPVHQAVYMSVSRLMVFSAKRCTPEDRRELACKGFLDVLTRYPRGSTLGPMLEAATSYVEQLAIVSETLAGKANTTLEARLRQLRKYLRNLVEDGCEEPLPITAHFFRVHLKVLLKQKVSPTAIEAAFEVVNFAKHVLGVTVEPSTLDSPWARGILRGARQDRPQRKQARALTVQELLLLEAFLRDASARIEDRYACGCFLFCTYARARWGDVISVSQFLQDFINDGGTVCGGYVELQSHSHKLRRKHGAMPLVAPVFGVGATPWAVEWLKVSQTCGCPLQAIGQDHVALLLPSVEGGWSHEPCVTKDARCWLRSLLERLVGPLFPWSPPGAHSMKATLLAMLAKFGASEADRLVLGHHSDLTGSLAVYSRDLQAKPLRALEACLAAVRAKTFLPDVSRSGYFPVSRSVSGGEPVVSDTLPGSILPGVPAEVFGPAGPSDGAASSRVRLEASTEDAVGPLDGDDLDGPIPSCADPETDQPCDVPARSGPPLQGGIDSTDESSSSSSSDSSSEAGEDPQADAPALRPPPAWREGCTVWRHSKTGTLHSSQSL